jgi:hypothetical protein
LIIPGTAQIGISLCCELVVSPLPQRVTGQKEAKVQIRSIDQSIIQQPIQCRNLTSHSRLRGGEGEGRREKGSFMLRLTCVACYIWVKVVVLTEHSMRVPFSFLLPSPKAGSVYLDYPVSCAATFDDGWEARRVPAWKKAYGTVWYSNVQYSAFNSLHTYTKESTHTSAAAVSPPDTAGLRSKGSKKQADLRHTYIYLHIHTASPLLRSRSRMRICT